MLRVPTAVPAVAEEAPMEQVARPPVRAELPVLVAVVVAVVVVRLVYRPENLPLLPAWVNWPVR